jgi:hypothetical protein
MGRKGRSAQELLPVRPIVPEFDKDELFATVDLDVDRVRAGEHLVPSDLLERGLKDKRLFHAWHGLLQKQKDKLANKNLARQVASMQARQMLFRPDNSDLDAIDVHDLPIEERVADMTARLRRKLEEMKVIEKATANTKRQQSALMDELDFEDGAKVEGIAETEDRIENALHRQDTRKAVGDALHREEILLTRKEQSMRERDAKMSNDLEKEGAKLFIRSHTLRDMDATVKASGGVAPAADTSHSHMGDGLTVQTLQDTPVQQSAPESVVPDEASWARVLEMNLKTDGFTERYIPGVGVRRCATHLGVAHTVVKQEHAAFADAALGMNWKDEGWFRPHEGHQIFNFKLAEALQHKTHFGAAEFAAFGVDGVSLDSFVRGVDLKYYRPVPTGRRTRLRVDTDLTSPEGGEEGGGGSITPFGSPAQRPSTVSGEMGRGGFMTPSGFLTPSSPFGGASTDRPHTSAGKKRRCQSEACVLVSGMRRIVGPVRGLHCNRNS